MYVNPFFLITVIQAWLFLDVNLKALRIEELLCCCIFRDLVAELPFILMHPKPEEDPPLPITARPSPSLEPSNKEGGDDAAVDTNLIQLDTWVLWLTEFN